jgi:hypothetical protein
MQDECWYEYCVQQVNLHKEHNSLKDHCWHERRLQRKWLIHLVLVWTSEGNFGKNEKVPRKLKWQQDAQKLQNDQSFIWDLVLVQWHFHFRSHRRKRLHKKTKNLLNDEKPWKVNGRFEQKDRQVNKNCDSTAFGCGHSTGFQRTDDFQVV